MKRITDPDLNAKKSIEKILNDRALELSERKTGKEEKKDLFPVLVFKLFNKRYSIMLENISEIIPFENCVFVPRSPEEVAGIINLRNEIICIFNLSDLLNIADKTADADEYVLILKKNTMGLKINEIEKILYVDNCELKTLASYNDRSNTFYAGTIHNEIILININQIIAKAMHII